MAGLWGAMANVMPRALEKIVNEHTELLTQGRRIMAQISLETDEAVRAQLLHEAKAIMTKCEHKQRELDDFKGWYLNFQQMCKGWEDPAHIFFQQDEARLTMMPDEDFEVMYQSWHKAKKKKNWKWRLNDQWGQLTSVKYVSRFSGQDGHFFLNYSIHNKNWSPIVTNKFVLKKALLCNATIEASKVGAELCLGGSAVLDEVRERNYTYNHYRNHTVRVPAGPDGRVRK